MFFHKKKNSRGFTLIELLVVIAIIGMLSSVVLSSLNTARAKARDAKRKQDLIQLRSALQMYYGDNGSYPLPNPSAWSGVSTAPTCGAVNGTTSGGSAYIPGLVPKYIPVLPTDPVTTGDCKGYLYNSNGSVYKLVVNATAESYPSAGQAFYDPMRPTWAWMICSGGSECNTW